MSDIVCNTCCECSITFDCVDYFEKHFSNCKIMLKFSHMQIMNLRKQVSKLTSNNLNKHKQNHKYSACKIILNIIILEFQSWQ